MNKIVASLSVALLILTSCSSKNNSKENPATENVVEENKISRKPSRNSLGTGIYAMPEYIQEIHRGISPAPDLQIKFPGYRFVIYDFGTNQTLINHENTDEDIYLTRQDWVLTVREMNDYEIMPKVNTDSVTLEEFLIGRLGENLVEIIPESTGDYFKLSASAMIEINEQWDFDDPTCLADGWWEERAVRWGRMAKVQPMQDSAKYFFRLPAVEELYEEEFKAIYSALNLRDTLVDRSGEFQNVATLVYKEKPCLLDIPFVLIRLDRYSKDDILIETKHIKIELSHGC